MFKNKWWYTLFLSAFAFYQGIKFVLFTPDEKAIKTGGWLFPLIHSQYGKAGLSLALFLVGFLLLYFSVKEYQRRN